MRITKQILMNDIEKKLKTHPEIRVVVKDMSRLRNGRWGLHAYEVGYDTKVKTIMVYPFSGATDMWVFDANRLNKPQLEVLKERVDNKLN